MRPLALITIASSLLISPQLAAASDDLPDPVKSLATPTDEDDAMTLLMLSQYVSRSMIDGHQWVRMTPDERAAYYTGYEDGVMQTAAYHLRNASDRNAAIMTLPTSAGRLPVDELVPLVDAFYAEEANRNIPLSFALVAIRNRRAKSGEGRSPEWDAKIDAYIESLQEMFRNALAEGEDVP